ncbi:MAG: aspartyl/asparaginyl beta-hydroxylase domain-containing protein [Pyrinomonadaceae bacterium]
MISSFKMLFSFDPKPLQVDVERFASDGWVSHFNQRYFEGEWTGLALRSVSGDVSQLYHDPQLKGSFVDTPLLDQCPNVQAALRFFQCPLRSVRFLKLAAGSTIREHRDYDLGFAEGQLRFHIPIFTNPDVDFFLDAQKVEMSLGECWYLDLSLPHWVSNRGATDRIHLVIDCELNEWLTGLIPVELEPVSVPEPSAPAELERFRHAVLGDLSLQQRLRLTSDRTSFIKLVATVGRENGYRFTAGDAEEALAAAHQDWIQRWID